MCQTKTCYDPHFVHSIKIETTFNIEIYYLARCTSLLEDDEEKKMFVDASCKSIKDLFVP